MRGGCCGQISSARKMAQYPDMSSQFVFHPNAVETKGSLTELARDLLSDVGRCIAACSGDDHECSFLFQQVSFVVQRCNSVFLHDTFCVEDQLD